MVVEFTGYHGTDLNSGTEIHDCQCFRESHGEDEWLGRGIYFFVRNAFFAEWWAKDYKHFTQYMILETKIDAEEDKILDVSDPTTLEEVDKWVAALTNKRRHSKSYANKEINDNLVMNYIYNNIKKFDVALGIFPFEKKKFKWLTSYGSRFKSQQIQICVRNTDCLQRDVLSHKIVNNKR